MTTTQQRHEVRIDNEIAEAGDAYQRAARRVDYLRAGADRLDSRLGEDREVGEFETSQMKEAVTERAAALGVFMDAQTNYDGWSRFYLVRNNNGHVHSSTNCSTCYSDTDFGWLTELSGLTEADAVAEYGGILCTVCFPSAPVEWTTGENKKDADRKARDAEIRRLKKTPEGKKVVGKADLVSLKTSHIGQVESRIEWIDRQLEDVCGDLSDHRRDQLTADRAADVAKLAKLRKQLDRAQTQLAEMIEAMAAVHGAEATALLTGEDA